MAAQVSPPPQASMLLEPPTPTSSTLNPTLNPDPNLQALTTLIFRAPALPTLPFSHTLTALINAAYRTIDPASAAPRLPRPSKLSEELGPRGFTAILFSRLPEGAAEEGIPIATASFKPWTDSVLEGLENYKLRETLLSSAEEEPSAGGPA
ncbi:MAG: hypothetical protein M1814_006930 [Vezdaea aestivalis]|nr:MAG: hypothetical protein M1814_006930 [Vezdaea aestivalis]